MLTLQSMRSANPLDGLYRHRRRSFDRMIFASVLSCAGVLFGLPRATGVSVSFIGNIWTPQSQASGTTLIVIVPAAGVA